MSPPRNRPGFEAARADRERIRAVLEQRTQAEPLLTPKAILRLLELPDARLYTVRRHIRAIRRPR